MPSVPAPDRIPADSRVLPWTNSRRVLGEGLRLVGDHLVTVDILDGTLTQLDPREPGDGRLLLRLDVPLGAVAPVAGRPDAWLAAAGTGVALINGAGAIEWLDRPEDQAPVPMRVNDGCCDTRGRFWFGTMPYDGSAHRGSLYRVERDGSVLPVLRGLTVPNGPAFTPDGTVMYLADSAQGRIDRYPLDTATGEPGEPTVFVQLPPGAGSPDGMTVDDEDHLWVAVWGAGAVHRYAPDGSLERVVTLAATQPTSPALYGGKLFVATARYGLDQPVDHDGKVLVTDAEGITAPAATHAVLN
jgi:sugar lactone lactonase YvrE